MQYPFVSKTLRDLHRPKSERKTHCCAMTLQNEGVGYDDLNDFMKHPTDLEFTMGNIHVCLKSLPNVVFYRNLKSRTTREL